MQAWENFLSALEQDLGEETVQKWLKPLTVIRFDACNLYLEAKDSFQALWFEEHIRQKVLDNLYNNNNKRIKVHLTIANVETSQPKPKVKKNKEQKNAPSTTFTLTFSNLDPHNTFENFVLSENNKLVFSLLNEISKDSKDQEQKHALGNFNPIFIFGPSGSGKTHLLTATAHALRQKGLNVICTHAENFTEHVVTAIRAGAMSTFRQAYRNIDVLLIDDVHVFSRKGATQEEFFHTFNTLHLAGKQIILSANCSPQELQLIEPRLVSRFEWGIVLPLEIVKKDELKQVLQNRAAALNFTLPPKITEFLLSTFKNSTKGLIKALETLILRHHLNPDSTVLSEALAKHHLADLMREEESSAVTPPKIIQAVADYYGIKIEDILGKAQTRDCVMPRQLAMFLCRDRLSMPFMKIGDLFSRDHSTVMSSVKQIQKNIESSENDVTSALSKILRKIQV